MKPIDPSTYALSPQERKFVQALAAAPLVCGARAMVPDAALMAAVTEEAQPGILKVLACRCRAALGDAFGILRVQRQGYRLVECAPVASHVEGGC